MTLARSLISPSCRFLFCKVVLIPVRMGVKWHHCIKISISYEGTFITALSLGSWSGSSQPSQGWEIEGRKPTCWFVWPQCSHWPEDARRFGWGTEMEISWKCPHVRNWDVNSDHWWPSPPSSIFRSGRCLLLLFLWEDTDRSANWVCDCLVEELTSFEFFLGGRVLYLWEDAELGFFSVEVERHIQKLSVLKFMNLFHLTF